MFKWRKVECMNRKTRIYAFGRERFLRRGGFVLCYTRYSPKQMSVNANGYNDEYDWGPNSALKAKSKKGTR